MFTKACPKGMRDMLPEDVIIRESVLDTIKKVYKNCGYSQIETPIVENIELLTGKEGGENEKLLFKILKRGEKLDISKENELCDLGLRYDLTLPLARYYANNVANLPTPFKAMQIGNVFRAERPQKGRYRQFIQCDIDIIGENSVLAEADLLSATVKALSQLKFSGFKLKINDRRLLSIMAVKSGFKIEEVNDVCISLDKADKIGFNGVRDELISNGFRDEIIDKYLGCVNSIIDSNNPFSECLELFGEEANEAIGNIKFLIDFMRNLHENCEIIFDPTLVRGMGYYTGTIFEIGIEGLPYSIAGGGRYDNLLGKIIGKDVSACGFSIGFERIVLLIKEREIESAIEEKNAIIIDKNITAEGLKNVYDEALKINQSGNVCSVNKKIKNFSLQISHLKAQGYKRILVYNESGVFKVIE